MSDTYWLQNAGILDVAAPILAILFLANWLGYKFRQLHIKKNAEVSQVGLGPAEASILGLTAFLLSFAFGMTASKFDTRRQVIIEESNDIGTVILRCDLYNDSIRNAFRADLKDYLEARIKYYEVGDKTADIQEALNSANTISSRIWKRASELGHNLDNRVATGQMVPALNAMIDIVSTREAHRMAVVPRPIILVLGMMSLISAFLTGYGSKNVERNKIMTWAFCIVTTLALYIVLELDRPRQGLINLNGAEKFMTSLRSNF